MDGGQKNIHQGKVLIEGTNVHAGNDSKGEGKYSHQEDKCSCQDDPEDRNIY